MDLLTCSQTMSRHEGSVTCLTMCQGRIISGSVDSTIKVLITLHIPHLTTLFSVLRCGNKNEYYSATIFLMISIINYFFITHINDNFTHILY